MKKTCVFVLLAALVAASAVPAAFGRTFKVPSRYKTVQRAIDAASPGDTVLVGPGVYKENLIVRKTVSLIGTAGAAKTVIDAGRKDIALRCEQVDSTAVIKGFTFRNGVGVNGGGVLLSSSFPTVVGNVFTQDSAKYGGGLCALWSNSKIRDNKFIRNRASFGGAVYSMFISPDIDSNLVEGNSAELGGGIFLAKSSAARVRGNVILENLAQSGGGMFLNGAEPLIEGNLFKRNRAVKGERDESEEGGAIGAIESGGVIRGNILVENSGARGGAVAMTRGAAPNLEGNTIALNSGVDSLCAGAYFEGVFPSIVNNLFYGNSPGYAVYCKDNATPVLSCNLFWKNSTGDYFGVLTDTHELREDPLLHSPEKGDFRLKEGSPALSDSCGVIGAQGKGAERR
ncbi:MAG: right-handed parallel beta-helix repeat-containing protein [Candidatus Eisenbacteria bacterium]|nr:right-handed parallel beta-helix repeat-containing protein [Candidatus Eisenbacteria bacterium]